MRNLLNRRIDIGTQAYGKAAVFCGAAPLLCGVLIFVGWKLTGHDVFGWLGMMNILGGLLLFCVGVFSLVVYSWEARKAKIEDWGTRSYLAGILLIANFPAAIFLTAAAAANIERETVVTVQNLSDYPVSEIAFVFHEVDYDFGAVAPHSQRTEKFLFKGGEGSVSYKLVYRDQPRAGRFIGYIDKLGVPPKTLLISAPGTIEVSDLILRPKPSPVEK